jgi:predicted acyltransferase
VVQAAPKAVTPAAPSRLLSLDAYRGFVMLAMVSAGLGIPQVAKHFPESGFWQALGAQLEHVTWVGCSAWDLIQPSFMFMVGVALPFSYAARRARGQSAERIWLHAALRSVLLILLGIFLISNWSRQTDWTFVNVLTQIGLGYMVVFALRGTGLVVQLLVAVAILVGYGAVFVYDGFEWDQGKLVQRPISRNEPTYTRAFAGPGERFPEDDYAAHWTKNVNFASDVDETFLSLLRHNQPMRFELFGREWESYLFCRTDAKGYAATYKPDPGGYTTLNFVPSIVTMIFGLMAGEVLRRKARSGVKLGVLVLAGIVCLLAALALDHYIWPDWLKGLMAKAGDAVGAGDAPFFQGYHDADHRWPWTVCPIVKRIWTPTWAVYSAGWTFLLLAAFYGIIDVAGWRRWSLPLVVVGVNSIAMYVMAMLLKPWIVETYKRHLGPNIFAYGVYEPLVQSSVVLLTLWLACLWMYRRKIFLRI